MKEVVADTNVLVSALLANPSSPPRIFLMKVTMGEVGLVLSPRLLLEIVSVFSRPKLRLLIPESKISDLVTLLHQSARVVKPAVSIKACRDPKDDVVLEAAVASKVSAVISGDEDLLVLHPFRGRLPILTPAKFLSSLKAR